MHDNPTSAAAVDLILLAVHVLVPLSGAVMSALAIRRRGRNARLALAGCLVMAPTPIVSSLALAFGMGPLMQAVGPSMAAPVLTMVLMPFHLAGFGLLLAGALSGPAQSPTQPSAPLEAADHRGHPGRRAARDAT